MDSDSLKPSENKAEIFHDEDLALVSFDDSIEGTDPRKAVWLIVCAVSMGGFLFGYDTGVICAVIVNLGGSMMADKYGRKLAIYIGCIIYFIGSIIQAAAFSLARMTVGRLIVGFGISEVAMIVPLYIGEMGPAWFRGRLIVFDNLYVTFSPLISYALGAAFTSVASGWRYMVGLGAIPAVLLVVTMPFCPEIPRQLVLHGRIEEAKIVLAKIFPRVTDQQVDAKARLIRHSIEESTASLRELFTVGANVRALITACNVMAVSQLSSFNTLMYYSTTLFSMVGFDKPTVVSICLSLVVASVAFWIPVNHDLTAIETREIGWPNILRLISLILCIAFYAAGVAPNSWRYLLGLQHYTIIHLSVDDEGNDAQWSLWLLHRDYFLSFAFAIFCYAEVHNMPLESVREIYARDLA
ncbi:myo-inositol transporter [Aspergillus alliaceus]|uniref:Myo-inositol transporter n=1 Tax=Petromyces alliaceus TaxID=209559 RepID=A0A8H6A4Y8_PETAA|nr:myo-inositol transporter [Aspergillus burnettii]